MFEIEVRSKSKGKPVAVWQRLLVVAVMLGIVLVYALITGLIPYSWVETMPLSVHGVQCYPTVIRVDVNKVQTETQYAHIQLEYSDGCPSNVIRFEGQTWTNMLEVAMVESQQRIALAHRYGERGVAYLPWQGFIIHSRPFAHFEDEGDWFAWIEPGEIGSRDAVTVDYFIARLTVPLYKQDAVYQQALLGNPLLVLCENVDVPIAGYCQG